MKPTLFNKDIEPACQYCEFGKLTRDRQQVLCTKKGSMQPYSSCRAFVYSPLKRLPTKTAKLPMYEKEDFEL